jgi:D-galactarolactone cycloisomerase
VKITAIRIQRLRLPLNPPFYAAWDPDPRLEFGASIVRVETDEGVTGVGSGDTMAGFEQFEHLFIGTDPLALGAHARTLETIAFHAGRCWPLEAALWDLAGRALGARVATLLGGASDRIAAYASLGELRAPERRAEDALRLIDEGFRAIKVRIARDRLEEGISVVSAIRAAAGARLEVMVDLNQWWRMAGDTAPGLGPADVRNLLDRLDELSVLWVEEPLAGADLSGMRLLRQTSTGGVRIAGGEMARTFEELHLALELDALDVYQPDVVLALGVSGARTLADLALRRNRWFSPHTWTNGIGLLANLHLCCGVGGGPFIEYPYDPPGWTPERRDFMLAEPLRIEADGCLALPAGPGLGFELDEDAIAFYAAELGTS